MRALGRTVAWSGLALSLAGGATAVLAQSRGEPAVPGSLAALTAEVRELRLAVQQLTQTQTQTQALGVYMSVQQGRVLHVSSQLDAARKELDAAVLRADEMGTKLADLEEELPRVSDPTTRRAIQEQTRELRREQAAAAGQEQQLRGREQELAQSLEAEEARWSTLISRLEALTQR